MKRIAILGASGQLGQDITKEFELMSDVQMYSIPRDVLDMSNSERVIDILEELGKFDIVINCTAYHDIMQCEKFPSNSFAINSISVLELSKYCNRNNILFVHFSTDYIFDGTKMSPYHEEDMPLPLNIYGLSKYTGEKLIEMNHDKYFIFRVSSLFGASGSKEKGGNFIDKILRMATNDQTITVVNDQIMSPTYTKEVARVVKLFIENGVDKYGIYHCCGEGECSWYELAETVFSLIGHNVDLREGSVKNGSNIKQLRPEYSVLSNLKLSQFYKMPHWQTSIEEYLSQKSGTTVNNGGGRY